MKKIKITNNGIFINGQFLPLVSGAFHYWRTKKQYWEDILLKIKRLGFNFVETYIPWNIHEPQRGIFDFEGNKNIKDFLKLCKKIGLYVIVRPGPHINAELDFFGFPKWVLLKEEVWAQTAFNTPIIYPYATQPFPLPSYSSSFFKREYFAYFNRIQKEIYNEVFPNGQIIMIQADNEYCYFFRDNPYILDYSKEVKKEFKSYLVSNNNAKLGKLPPERYDSQKPELSYEWIKFKEKDILKVIKTIGNYWHRIFPDIIITHNIAYHYYAPFNLPQMEKLVDIAGIDLYLYPKDYKEIKRRCRYLAGTSKLAFIPEFISGVWFDNSSPPTIKEQKFVTYYALMNGIAAFNFYMIVERDRWLGCPITNTGKQRNEYVKLYDTFLKIFSQIIREARRKIDALLIFDYEEEVKEISQNNACFSSLESNCFIKGLSPPNELFCNVTSRPSIDTVWLKKIERRLEFLGLDYNYTDTNSSFDKRGQTVSKLFIMTYEQMSKELQQKIIRAAKNNYEIILPQIPHKDLAGKECRILENFIKKQKPSNLIIVPDYPEHQLAPESTIEIVIFFVNTHKKYLFIANCSNDLQNASLKSFITPKERYEFLFNESKSILYERNEVIHISIPSYSVNILKVLS